MSEHYPEESYTDISMEQKLSVYSKMINSNSMSKEDEIILNEIDLSINFEEWKKTFIYFLLHLLSVYGIFATL